MLDVVYNHLGPEGAYLTAVQSGLLHHAARHAVGRRDQPRRTAGRRRVRRFILDNALHWIREYHVDGLRLDATHALIDDSRDAVVAELAAAARAAAALAGHDSRRRSSQPRRRCIEAAGTGGWGLDGVWADDFHHIVRRRLAGDSRGYYQDYEGTADELARTIRQGWLFTGPALDAHATAARGTDPSRDADAPLRRLPAEPRSDRQSRHRRSPAPSGRRCRLAGRQRAAAHRADDAAAVHGPGVGARASPFQYFTDLEPELGGAVTEGRRHEFKDFPEFSDPAARERIPDPQAIRDVRVAASSMGGARSSAARVDARALQATCSRCGTRIRRSQASEHVRRRSLGDRRPTPIVDAARAGGGALPDRRAAAPAAAP